MGLGLFLIIIAVFVILAIISYVIWEKSKSDSILEYAALACCITSFVIAIISALFVLGWLITYPYTQTRYGELTGQGQTILTSYSEFVYQIKGAYYDEELPAVNLHLNKLPSLDLGLENLKQSTNVSKLIVKLQQDYADYNTEVGRYQSRWKSSWWRLFMPKPPEDLQLLTQADFQNSRTQIQ